MRVNWRCLLAAAMLSGVADVCSAGPPTVSRETTYYLGPLDEEGYVDYYAAVNAAFGHQGAKP